MLFILDKDKVRSRHQKRGIPVAIETKRTYLRRCQLAVAYVGVVQRLAFVQRLGEAVQSLIYDLGIARQMQNCFTDLRHRLARG